MLISRIKIKDSNKEVVFTIQEIQLLIRYTVRQGIENNFYDIDTLLIIIELKQ